jgi:hypothetical protein
MSSWTDEVRQVAHAAGKPQRPTPKIKGKAPSASASATSLNDVVRACGLPAAVASEFRSAGIVTAEDATPLLHDFVTASARNPAAAQTSLRLRLLSRATYNRSAHQ